MEPSESMFTRSVSPEQAPDTPMYLEIEFERGDPVALNGAKLSPASLLTELNKVTSFAATFRWQRLAAEGSWREL